MRRQLPPGNSGYLAIKKRRKNQDRKSGYSGNAQTEAGYPKGEYTFCRYKSGKWAGQQYHWMPMLNRLYCPMTDGVSNHEHESILERYGFAYRDGKVHRKG